MKNRRVGKSSYMKIGLGAIAGLGMAFAVFLWANFILYGDFHFITHMREKAADITPMDILVITATILGGISIGGTAMMQYQKHKWEGDTSTGERLCCAIEHLGNDNEPIRVGAICELERLAEDSSRDRERIAKILILFLQDKNSAVYARDTASAVNTLELLVRRELERTKKNKRPLGFVFDAVNDAVNTVPFIAQSLFPDWKKLKLNNRVDLKGINLNSVDIQFGKLKGVDLQFSILENSNLSFANLEGANLFSANLTNTSFFGANLKGAKFFGATLNGTDFRQANLEGVVELCEAQVTGQVAFDPSVRERYFKSE